MDKHDNLSVENQIKETSELEMCLFVFINLSLGRRMLCMINLSCECFNTLVAIERFYLSVCQHVRVQIGNSSASVVALTAFVRLLPMCVLICILKLGECTQGRHW